MSGDSGARAFLTGGEAARYQTIEHTAGAGGAEAAAGVEFGTGHKVPPAHEDEGEALAGCQGVTAEGDGVGFYEVEAGHGL